SDVSFTTGRTVNTVLISGENDLTWDAGLVPLATIGDRVWADLNNNGIQDSGESGISGVTVNLTGTTTYGAPISRTTTTDANGNYLFDLLPPGNYAIEVVLPPGYQFSPQDQGGSDAADSDVNFATGRTVTTTLLPGEDDRTWDAGLVPLATIGDRVWRDNNGNGIQDAGEPGLPGVTVNLIGTTTYGASVNRTTTTDASGNYLFTLVPPGTYQIEIVPLTPGYIVTPLNQGGDPAADSDIDPATNRTTTTVLTPGEDDRTWDAGLLPLPTIGDRVWYDNNGDGRQDPDEPGAPNVTVRLLDQNGTIVRETATDANGNYLFENVLPGQYRIAIVVPGGYTISPPNTGAADVDSDLDPETGRSPLTTLVANEIDLTWDAGLVPLASIGDRVWNDLNGDGVQDPGEPGIPGVRIILIRPDGVEFTTTTDANGVYFFSDLPAGTYTIRVDRTTLPNGYGQTYDLTGPLDHTATYILGVGERTTAVDFGYVQLGSIGDTIWIDANRNGRVDGGERGIPGVTVRLVLPDGSTRTTTTNAQGQYVFDELFPGTYTVIVDVRTLPPGLVQVYDPDRTRDHRTTVVLGAGQNVTTADFGYARPVVGPTPPPDQPEIAQPEPWQPVPACQRACVTWDMYHSNATGDWEIMRLGNLTDRPAISPNLSQGEGATDMSPSRSPNAEWIVFASDRDGNWELYVAPTDGDSSRTQRLTFNTVAIDTDPVWGPNNFVVFESTRDGNWELYLLDMTTGDIRRLTDNPASDLNAYWSPDGTRILFQSDRSGLWQIYELNLATGAITLLSDGSADDVDPQYSETGSLIAFRSYRDGDQSSIYLMNADGSGVTRISELGGDATNAAWSPDSAYIAYQSDLDGDLDIYVYELSSGRTRKLTDNDIADYAPTWQCGTTRVIFTSDVNGEPDIYEVEALPMDAAPVDLTTDAATRLTFDPAADIYPENSPVEENASREGALPGVTLGQQTRFLQPDVSTTEADPSLDSGEAFEPVNSCETICPAWTLIYSDRTGDGEIFRLGTDGGADFNLSQGVAADDRGPTRAPNAQWIAFTSDRDGNEEIYIASADGTSIRRVTNNDAADTDPVWSPDSQRLVFESDSSGNWDLYILDVQTGVETQITRDPADDRNADWSAAGNSIVFESTRDGRSQIYVYDLRTGETRRLVETTGAATNPVYSSSGTMIAFTHVEPDGRTAIYVVQQDGSGLTRISEPAPNAGAPEWYFDDTLITYQSDLDGDLDVYVYDFATGQTRKLTDNAVADYAPTWRCGAPEVIFTSDVTGNPDIFRAEALPIDRPAIDVQTDALQLTDNPARDRFPVGAPNDEEVSRMGM
ncbi:MAG: SdrD B-like domain-containing protein, partial [Candidatus Flexifilum sp.]